MIRVDVLAPVLSRPARALPLAESLQASYAGALFDLRLMFLATPEDCDQIQACEAAAAIYDEGVVTVEIVGWKAGPGDYARKINHGWRLATAAGAQFVFLGADDLVFHPGWVEQAVATHLDTGACVIGANDLGSRGSQQGTASTHSLVHRWYRCGTADNPDPGLLLHEGYDHNFVDNEFVETAIARGVYAHALHARVEHLHPIWRKATTDDTYKKGQRLFMTDRGRFSERWPLWQRLSAENPTGDVSPAEPLAGPEKPADGHGEAVS